MSGGDTGIRFIIPQNEHLRAIRFSVGKISSYKSLSSHKRKKDTRWIAILIVEFTVVRRPRRVRLEWGRRSGLVPTVCSRQFGSQGPGLEEPLPLVLQLRARAAARAH